MKHIKVLVTGSRGFLGAAVCRLLQSRGAVVHGVGRSSTEGGFEVDAYHSVDLSVADTADDLMAKVQPQYIIHLAGCSVARREPDWIETTLRANLLTTVNILRGAQCHAVTKTVLAGSLEEPDITENNVIPTSPYAASKWAASGYARMIHELYRIRVVIARIFMVYGPGQKELQKLIPYVCLSAMAGKPPSLMSGTRLVDWVYVDDVADGLVRLLQTGPIDGSHVDIGTGRLVSTGDVAELICRLAGTGVCPDIGAIPDRAMEQIRKADVEQTIEVIGWRPKIALEDGLERTFEWYKHTHDAM